MSVEFSGCCRESEVELCSFRLISDCALKLCQLSSSFLHQWPCFLWSGALLSHQHRILSSTMWCLYVCCVAGSRGMWPRPAVSGFRGVQLILNQTNTDRGGDSVVFSHYSLQKWNKELKHWCSLWQRLQAADMKDVNKTFLHQLSDVETATCYTPLVTSHPPYTGWQMIRCVSCLSLNPTP